MGSTGKGHRELPDAVSKTSDSDVQRKYIVFAGLDNSGASCLGDDAADAFVLAAQGISSAVKHFTSFSAIAGAFAPAMAVWTLIS